MKTIAMLTTILCALATADTQQHWKAPDEAASALETAVKSPDAATRLVAVLGPGSDKIVSSGDPVEDAAARKRFATALAARKRIEISPDGAMAVLIVGHDDWPFPVPLVKDADGWRFNAADGVEELLNRRIGRNELSTLSTVRAYVDAQREYAKRFHTYSQALRSQPGKQDGLYWESDHDVSPLGPLVADATAEGYTVRPASEPPAPYHGYFFRVLTAQGAHAPGGARDYVKDGKMTGGFGLVAWPAEHGSSGVMTFMVGPQGVVFQKNLGDGTAEAVKAITTYDPDESWQPTR